MTQNMDSFSNTYETSRAMTVNSTLYKGTYYDIPLDTNIKMVYAFLPSDDGFMRFHENNYGFFNIELNSQTGSCTRHYTQQRVMSIHGWLMWFSWTLIGMFQIILNRYLKYKWEYNQTMHNILGLSAGVMTIFAFVLMLDSKNWHMSFHGLNHSSFGLISLGLGLMLIMGGIFAWFKRSRANEWNTHSMLKMKRIHMYFGYFMFLWVQTAVCTGIITRVINAN